MRITLTGVFVDNQEMALAFYTGVLGFVMKQNIPVGEDRFLTVVSPEDPDGTELLLEPNHNPVLHGIEKQFQEALFNAGIPVTAFNVPDIRKECERLKKLGVVFRMEPTKMGPVTQAVFDDTCGNLIQLYQV